MRDGRRKMMESRVCSATLVALGTLLASSAPAQDVADRIWSGGPVLTMNDAAMRAEAVAEKDGRILGVGTEEEVMKLGGPDTQVIDLAGRTMLPGFVDAHGHMFLGGFQALQVPDVLYGRCPVRRLGRAIDH